MNRFYDAFVSGLVDSSLGDWSSVAWKLSLHDSTAVFDATDTNVSSLTGQVGDRITITGSVSGGVWSQTGHGSVTTVPSAKTIVAAVLAVGTTPVVWFDRGGDLMPISLLTTGDDIDVWGLRVRLVVP